MEGGTDLKLAMDPVTGKFELETKPVAMLKEGYEFYKGIFNDAFEGIKA